MGNCRKPRSIDNGEGFQINSGGTITRKSHCGCGKPTSERRRSKRYVVTHGYGDWCGTSLNVVAEFDNRRDDEEFVKMKNNSVRENVNS